MLKDEIKNILQGKKFITALNSEPYTHVKTLSGIHIKRGSGGAQHLMDYIFKKTGGTMVAVGSGSADRAVIDTENKIAVPPEKPSYDLKRIFITKEEVDQYYYGFSNQTLWPLCHLTFVKPLFEKRWFTAYKKVNERFASAILEEAGDSDAFVWVNDYQLCLLPQLLKERNPKLTIGTFWHIPWPIPEIFSICPWSRELLEGLLASDFIGFHQQSYVHNFIKTAISELKIDILPHGSTLYHNKHNTKIHHLPAGIDYEEIHNIVDAVPDDINAVKRDLDIEYDYLVIGVDRIDYTKGLVERLRIIETLLKKHPDMIGRMVHLMIGSPSRAHVPAYKQLTNELLSEIDRINWTYQEGSWNPICFVHQSVEPDVVYTYYREADVCIVSSLDDGMNLVAKEYPICVRDGAGALVVSKYTGASRELKNSFQINPYNVVESAELLYKALLMPKDKKREKIESLRSVLRKNNIDNWAKHFILNSLP
jgi:trehalose 6-phosphate synthase